jgi:lipopolysaccharide transport system permease protein
MVTQHATRNTQIVNRKSQDWHMATVITSRSDSVAQHLNPVLLARNLWRHRDLIRQFTRREVEGRYRGSYLGIVWSFVTPLIMLLIYTFVFGIVLQARWPQARTTNLNEFAVVLFAGLSAFNIFGETVSRAPGLIIGVPNYVKKVVFPLEVLPISVLGAALFHALINLVILLAAHLLIGGALHPTLLLLPVMALPLLLLGLGLAWFLASLGVFIRDISYSVSLIVQILFFLTPIFYPIESIPEAYRPLIALNPLTAIIENIRRVTLWGQPPDWFLFLFWLIATSMMTILGYAWFMKTKKAFADVI